MFSTTSIFRLVISAAALGIVSAMVLAPGAARAEAAHNSRGDDARVGNWVGSPLAKHKRNRIPNREGRIKIIERAADRQSCRDSLFVQAHPRKCPGESGSREIAFGVNIDQALNTVGQEPVARNPASGLAKSKPTAEEKAPPLKSTARLNVEEPGRTEPKSGVNPETVQSKASEKESPELQPTLSCDKAGAIVGDFGFSAIKPSDCDGQVYAFAASRDGKPFKITLNSASGELIQVRKAPSELLRHGH